MLRQKEIPYEIRWIAPQEWDEAMGMIWETFLKFEAKDYSPGGILNFDHFLHDGQLHAMYEEGKYQMMVALDQGKVIGAISVRSGNFISLLFVQEEYHKKGIGSALITKMATYLKEQGEIYMTLRAAPYAVGFYRKLGFRISRPEEEVAGIRVTAMEKFL